MASQTNVIPLLVSNIAWAEYIKNVADLTGHSPTCGIDNCTLKLSDYARYIATLGEFHSGKDVNPLNVLRESDYILKHLFFGFLISGSTSLVFRILELTDLNVLTAKGLDKTRVAVVTGSLFTWKNAIITCLEQSLVSNYELRWVFNQCLNTLRHTGLGNIFDSYRRKGLTDQTFLLEYKK